MSDLFIIGAGASKPYGFPTGEELFEIIRNLDFSSEDKRKTAYKKYYGKDFVYNDNNILKFMENLVSELEKSMMVSIDDFIRNRDFGRSNIVETQAGLVKRIIAKTIFECEENAKTKRVTDWLHYLCSLVDRINNREGSKFFFLNSKFITFNYDRLLEYSVYKYFDCDKGVEEREIAEMLKNMHIIHANGYLGPLYHARFGYKDINDASVKTIKTAWDNNTDDTTKIINEYIDLSDRIFFLGFGYLEENMKKLGLTANTKILAGKKIFGTAYKMSDYKIRDIESRLKLCGALQPNIKDCETVDLIRDFFQ